MDWDFHTIQLGAQQGWQCPVCGNVNAPWVMQCPCNGRLKTYTTTVGTGKTLEYKVDYGRPTKTTSTGDQTIYKYNPLTTATTATSPKNTTTTLTSSQPEDNCENCLGGCDLCYYCKNGDHYTYKGWYSEKK